MIEKRVIHANRVPNSLLASLDTRDVALWIRKIPQEIERTKLVRFLGLPWRLVMSEVSDVGLFSDVQKYTSVDDPLTRKRGYVQLIDSDPSRIALPERSLPFYLLGGSEKKAVTTFADRLRRMTMLESLRRSSPREILIISDDLSPVPDDFMELWSSGFRCYVTITSNRTDSSAILDEWIRASQGFAVATLLQLPSSEAILQIGAEYDTTYPETRHIIRVRALDGTLPKLDVTSLDEPERPILESYTLIEERDLTPLTPVELGEQDFVSFFRDPASSWRPYAAGLPWMRDPEISKNLLHRLRRLDVDGSEENSIAYIAAESGAGGTTLVRALSWECARLGYPGLVARPIPFVPDALPVANFLTRVHAALETRPQAEKPLSDEESTTFERTRRYEVPWLIVFDTLHWQYRESDLIRFKNELTKSGRPVCILVVTGAVMPLGFINSNVPKLAELTHAIEMDEARNLGIHLNQFLRAYGHERPVSQWENFYREHTVRWVEGIAAFWVALSFWIQGQYDLSESIQEWMYRSFKQNADDPIIQDAIVQIAALSSERLPMPEVLLPNVSGRWPTSQLLSDRRSSLAAVGLVQISKDTDKFWSLVHDILGRLLINALFYDFHLRQQLGFANANSAEHLRFLLLRKISQHPALGEQPYRSIGEDFATTIFKIDPDHGHGNFVGFWREVLDALNDMPRGLRDSSRLFRHHCAISRRRIAKLDEHFYGVTKEEKIALLKQAVEDIRYALEFIEYTPASESNLNLYNSLANAYFDLAEAEANAGATPQRLVELRNLGNDATRRAYGENPTNSFVIETYVKNLLQNARIDSGQAVELCIEGLGILFSAMAMNEAGYRAAQLGTLADKLLGTLFAHTSPDLDTSEPGNAVDVLVQAWMALASGSRVSDLTLADVPEAARARALDRLRHPAGRGNMQVIRMTYDLLSAQEPFQFDKQLELLEQLVATDYRLPAQLRLEYAILLFQNGRPSEGDRTFRDLRRLWRETEQVVQIPDRLRWLRGPDPQSFRTVSAIVGSDIGIRAVARVNELGGISVPFRPEEFGIRVANVGLRFASRVTFGHNGPFLRPVTVDTHTSLRGARA